MIFRMTFLHCRLRLSERSLRDELDAARISAQTRENELLTEIQALQSNQQVVFIEVGHLKYGVSTLIFDMFRRMTITIYWNQTVQRCPWNSPLRYYRQYQYLTQTFLSAHLLPMSTRHLSHSLHHQIIIPHQVLLLYHRLSCQMDTHIMRGLTWRASNRIM